MAKQDHGSSLEVSTRKITLTLEPISGGITMFYAFINGSKVIAAEGNTKRFWTGDIPDAETRIKIRIAGIDDAIFKFTIDLPGTANDQSMNINLTGGYFETEIHI